MDVGQMVNKLEAIRAGLERLKAEEREVAAALAAAAPGLASYANGFVAKRQVVSGLAPYDVGLVERVRAYVEQSTAPFRYMELCRAIDGRSDSIGHILKGEERAGRVVKISRGLYCKPGLEG